MGASEEDAPTSGTPTRRPPQTGRPPAARSRARGIATVLTLAIVAGYAFVSATFTLPDSPAKPVVSDVFSPYFSQQWNVFAPNIMKVNRELQVQVQWREGGKLVHSDWVDVTDLEFAAARGIPSPSRVTKNTFNAAQTYLDRYNALSGDQKTRVRDTFIRALGGGNFAPIPDADLVDAVDALGSSRDAVVRFIRYDYMLTRFAAAFGTAYFDRDVERVRWRVEQQRPNDFAHRFDTEPQNQVSYVTFGWRQPAVAPTAEVVGIFDDVIERYGSR